ncbi:chloramphenicol-sensitive protein RarD [Parasphingorhabdus marina DSM 22363]|uniref:Chloramphenicol-sensitive protein RarD n=1 Tax=Parasphingorhabdus marina DSM 22363 TaxID=1123272 RepID=A0A1N6CN85_9SPHN|nr:EamA family transporter RarD [Parasphingorhabdus marina]SIN59962.1 chloramphenicol-sensitive protein RarD [Parasphingorhabdus marina DSM 22363]
MTQQQSDSPLGLVQALIACTFWGVMPIYFKLLQVIPPLEVVAHRAIWLVPLLLLILWFRKNISGLKAALADPKILGYLFLSAFFIAANWSIYVWAVQEDHVLAASLGYFISPLLIVFLGSLVLKEKLTRNQWIAVAVAAAGVSVLAVEAWQTLWISLLLAGSWGLYGLIRKVTPVGPMVGLTVETGLLFPLFLAWLIWLSMSPEGIGFGQSWPIDLLLIGGAAVTAIPLLLFAAAVRTVSLTTMGLLQYVAPIMQFLIGVFVYNEPLTTSHMICFGLIWISLAIFSADAWRNAPGRKPAATV